MHKLILVIVCWGCWMGAEGQRDGQWVLGYNYYPDFDMAIDFRSGTADTITIPKNLYTFISFSEICDTTGNILFYTNGETISNRIGDTLEAGYLLRSTTGRSYSIYQGTLILPFSNSSNKYHLFYETLNSIGSCNSTYDLQPFGLYHSVVDMNLDTGLGGVATPKDLKVLQETLIMGKLTACKHANGKDWWVITHEYLTDIWIKLLIKDDTVFEQSNQAIGYPYTCLWDIVGQATFSRDGEYYAICGSDLDNRVSLFTFDRCTGELAFSKNIQFPGQNKASQGVSFSPNNKYLYITTHGSNVWQYDIGQDSLRLVGHVENANWDNLYLQQLAPDGKIYISTGSGEKHLHVIHNPDFEGAACNFDSAGFVLRTYNSTIPTFPNFNLGPLPGSPCDTLTSSIPKSPVGNLNSQIEVYPNPSSDHITIDYGFIDWNQGDVSLEITNSLGQVVFKQMLPKYSGLQQIDVSQFASGVYMASIKRNTQVVAAAKFSKH